MAYLWGCSCAHRLGFAVSAWWTFLGREKKPPVPGEAWEKQLLKPGKLMDRLQSFFTWIFCCICYVQDAQGAWTLNWFELRSLGPGGAPGWKGSQCRILQLTVNSHIHRLTQASFSSLQRTPGLTPLSSSTTKQVLIFAEGSKCCCSRHENPVNIPFQFDLMQFN